MKNYDEYDNYQSINQEIMKLALNDSNELREIAKHMRAIERDERKSNLKIAEMERRQALKDQYSDIGVYNCSIIKQFFDGNGKLINRIQLLSCQIEKIQCYRYEETKEIYWQIFLKVKEAEEFKIIESPLYEEIVLQSISKLRTTILCAYCINDLKQQIDIWRWIQKLLICMINYAQVKVIPSFPGWWKQEGKWHFVTSENEKFLPLSDNIKRFSIKKSEGLTDKEVVKDLVFEVSEIPRSDAGILMLYRMNTFMGRLIGDRSFSLAITLIGESAERVAKTFLRTMYNEVDTISLDGDSLKTIYKRLQALQDTPAIFLVSNPDNRSTRNRLERILSFKNSGYIDGIKKPLVFVFCLKKFSSYFPFDDMIVLDVGGINPMGQYRSFDKLQNYIIAEIENSGEYWPKELKRAYEKHFLENGNNIISINKAIAQILHNMLKLDEMDESTYTDFQNMLQVSESKIRKQVMSKKGILMETFQEKVKELAGSGKISVVNKDKVPTVSRTIKIYFDDKYYYFIKDTLNIVCEYSNIDFHSLLSLKQQLAEQGILKMYKATCCRSPELEIDFRIHNDQGEYKDLSGLAISRDFFDEMGGVSLYELYSE